MTERKMHGNTAGGLPITDELVDVLAEKAKEGYDVDKMLYKGSGDAS